MASSIPSPQYSCDPETKAHRFRYPGEVVIILTPLEPNNWGHIPWDMSLFLSETRIANDLLNSLDDLRNLRRRIDFQAMAENRATRLGVAKHDWEGYLLALIDSLSQIDVPTPKPTGRQKTKNASSPNSPPVQDPPTEDSDDNLPWINADCQDTPVTAEEAWHALLAANDPPTIFLQGTNPIRVEQDQNEGVHAVEVNVNRWRYHLSRAAHFYRPAGKDGVTPAIPPTWLVEDMLARPEKPLPLLTRIVEVPVFAPNGTLQTTAGYHPDSRTFLMLPPNLEIQEVPTIPTTDDVHLARLLIDEMLIDFPFSHDAECEDKRWDNLQYQTNHSHAYALFLLPFARDLISDPTPNHLIEASSAGSGKGLLAEALLRPSMGDSLGIVTEAKDEDEWRKRLTTRFKEAKAAILLDNIKRPLDSGQVAAALTARTWEDRKLGTNETISVPVRCVWCMTGNNPVMTTEIARRTIRIRLDPKMDRPWLRRDFKHSDLIAWGIVKLTGKPSHLFHWEKILAVDYPLISHLRQRSDAKRPSTSHSGPVCSRDHG